VELLIAFAVLAAGAVIALRSATSTVAEPETLRAPEDHAGAAAREAETTAAAGEAAAEAEATAAAGEASVGAEASVEAETAPYSPDALLAEHPNGQSAGTLTPDPDATLTAAHPAPGPQPTAAAATAAAATAAAVAVKPELIAITEDRTLDDVLSAAAEDAIPPKHPTLRLLIAISGLAFAFAAALLLVVRGIQALWASFFG
jgi:hypothetical protein